MKKLMFLAIVVLSALMVSCGNDAQQKVEEARKARANASFESSVIASWKMAHKLAAYGYENGSAFALTEAADILVGIPMNAETIKLDEAGAQNPDQRVKETKPALSIDQLVADAMEMSGNNPSIAERVEEIKRRQAQAADLAYARGAVGGAYVVSGTVYASSYQVYACEFEGGEMAHIAVVGDGDSDLDIIIMDANKKIVASDESYDLDCEVMFMPEETGVYYMKVVNNDDICNNFTLATN